jgi:hypothetical protein
LTTCASRPSARFTFWPPSQSFSAPVASAPSPRNLCCPTSTHSQQSRATACSQADVTRSLRARTDIAVRQPTPHRQASGDRRDEDSQSQVRTVAHCTADLSCFGIKIDSFSLNLRRGIACQRSMDLAPTLSHTPTPFDRFRRARVEPDRRPSLSNLCCLADQAARNKGSGHGAGRVGAHAGKPRCVRILTIAAGSSMAAMIFKSPPQCGRCSISMWKTRLSSPGDYSRKDEKR